jgi:hypothetical protein
MQHLDGWVDEAIARSTDGIRDHRVANVGAASAVRRRQGERLITDGPFTETKEWITGFAALEHADLDDDGVVEAHHPAARFGRNEVRPRWRSDRSATRPLRPIDRARRRSPSPDESACAA